MAIAGIASWAGFGGSLTMSLSIFKQHIKEEEAMCFSSNSMDIIVLVGVFASILDILFVMQLVRGLNLYVIAL